MVSRRGELIVHQTQSLFSFLGLTVQSELNGVYLLHNPGAAGMTYIALLFSPEIVKPPQVALQLFMLEVPLAGADVAQRQWGELDARRLAESGITPLELAWGPIESYAIKQRTFLRSDGRTRHAVELSPWDIVCYN